MISVRFFCFWVLGRALTLSQRAFNFDDTISSCKANKKKSIFKREFELVSIVYFAKRLKLFLLGLEGASYKNNPF